MRIAHITSVVPPYTYQTAEIVEAADQLWLSKLPESTRRFSLRIFKGAEIESRSSVVDLKTAFSDLSFEEKNQIYIKAVIEHGVKVLKKGLEEANIRPEEIDALITTSCTGFMIPSVDAYIVNQVGLRQNILRLPVTEMGCAGGTAALIYANQFLSNPNSRLKKVAILALEVPSITFLKSDLSPENLVSTAIFADGFSCVIVDNEKNKGPVVLDQDMYHFPQSEHLMGYNLQNEGLKIVLHKDVPDAISEHFPKIMLPFLDRNKVDPKQVSQFLIHPGGKKIIAMASKFLAEFDKNMDISKDVLKVRGNMSSATIFHILEKCMNNKALLKEKDLLYLLAFGPGFCAQQLLLEYRV